MNDRHTRDSSDIDEAPLDPWMATLVSDANEDVVVPRDLMWARIRKARSARQIQAQRHARYRRFAITGIAVAATLIIGIGIGRETASVPFGVTDPVPTFVSSDTQATVETSPVRIAMHEHLLKTAVLLTSVGKTDPDARPKADITAWSQELLTTTRMLLDSPEAVADDNTRRLLEDLEIVLMQIIQSRGTSAPEARRAPSETMRETNLLPRVRAAVTTASTVTGEFNIGGASE